MQTHKTSQRYSNLMITLHWLMAVLMVLVYASIELREIFPKGSDPREAMKAFHFMLGLSVLLLILLRIYARFNALTPAINPPLTTTQALFAKVGHVALYVLMFMMPILGWLTLSAAGKPIPFFGLELPALIEENKDLAKSLKSIHETIGVLGYWLIGLHVLAAIYHHHIRKDDTLYRILPGRK